MKCNYTEFCRTQIEPFILNDEEKDLYKSVGSYLTGGQTNLDAKKGMFIRGVIGSGKTIMFKMAQRFKEKNCKLKFINTEKLSALFEDGQKIDRYLKDEWVFDDLGTEQKSNNYGKGVEIFKRVIEDRYDKWKYEGLRTHFTSNCSNDLLQEKYGERAYDRLKEMCNVIKYPASTSKRGKSEIKILTTVNDMPEKTEEQKECELKAVMNEIFQELNELYKKKDFKFSDHNGVKYYGCLKYFDLMPDYKDKELWAKAIEQEKLKHVNSFDSKSRGFMSFLMNPKEPTSKDISEKVTISVKNRYKNLLASKCVRDLEEFYDDLNKAID